ncbi:hypothetical protein BD324DRAFT_53264 [Kockovaella imperatae]|uniref:Uncharacterized protein n=1 Tax=Kockovaella imperatae TaxID=4999 RepID=A0A1Y1UTB4_9TREE|nr:hypothetical protein BD324DRAFT_53264 [Kockovaella imperatae]ORX41258.1 hypothetical protein BD324DRAFT_53264 [Kockovaella imperatae]
MTWKEYYLRCTSQLYHDRVWHVVFSLAISDRHPCAQVLLYKRSVYSHPTSSFLFLSIRFFFPPSVPSTHTLLDPTLVGSQQSHSRSTDTLRFHLDHSYTTPPCRSLSLAALAMPLLPDPLPLLLESSSETPSTQLHYASFRHIHIPSFRPCVNEFDQNSSVSLLSLDTRPSS